MMKQLEALSDSFGKTLQCIVTYKTDIVLVFMDNTYLLFEDGVFSTNFPYRIPVVDLRIANVLGPGENYP